MKNYATVSVQGHNIFYREAGDRKNPTLLLLHGFPSSSHMFRNLIPRLADRFHIVAPDLPGFGFTQAAPGYTYNFDNLAKTIEAFTDALHLDRYAIYVFDYGAPVGFRLAVARPEKITAIITQNGNAYEEGLSDGWGDVKAYWAEQTPANREKIRPMTEFAATRWQYVHGTGDESLVAPESYTLDAYLMTRPGNADIQLDLLLDYCNNIKLYPKFHEYFRAYHPPVLAVWGKNDPFFIPPGAEAFKRDSPNTEVHFYDTGHFALETHAAEIGEEIARFLNKNVRT